MQVDAAAFLRERQSTQHVGGVTELLPYFGGEEGSQCRRNVVELMENDELIAAKRQDLLAIMKTQLYLEVVNRCSNEISLYDQASGLVCLLEEDRSNYNTTYAQFWGGDGRMLPHITSGTQPIVCFGLNDSYNCVYHKTGSVYSDQSV